MILSAAHSKPLIMGILNATPDSFSDGGLFNTVDKAVEHGLAMAAEGADIIDVGGESTRPGSEFVAEDEQIARVVPVIRGLRARLPADILISIDTTRQVVAEAAVSAGARLVNDVSAGRDDPEMFRLVARLTTSIVLMHMQGTPKTMQDKPAYTDVVGEVMEFLLERAEQAMVAGISRTNIIIDPGIGFGKRREDNLKLLANLDQFVGTGFPVLLGASRKRFMGAVCRETEPTRLLGATVATTALGVMKGVRLFRVHDVRANRQGADVAAAILGVEGGDRAVEGGDRAGEVEVFGGSVPA